MTQGETKDQVVRAAWLYYQEGLTQDAVARALDVSRQKAQRLLQEARERGIVQVRIQHPSATLLSIERSLTRRFGLQEAVVAPHSPMPGGPIDGLGKAAADCLERHLSSVRVLGVGLGRSLHVASQHFRPACTGATGCLERPSPTPAVEGRSVVSVMGNLLGSSAMNPYTSGERLAERWGASFYNLWAPAVVRDEATADVFRSEPWIRKVLKMGEAADLVVSGLGVADERTTLAAQGYLSSDELDRLRSKGARGCMLGQFFDADGRVVEDPLHSRVLALTLGRLAEIGGALVIARGPDKVKALHSAILGGLVRILVTDEPTAQSLLENAPS